MPYENPFATAGIWLKANLHTHTTNSDGDTEPAERVAQYVREGYDVLALTDHRQVTPIEALERDDIILLQSAELHPACPNGPVYHLVGLNLPADFEAEHVGSANELIAAVRAAGGEAIAAHPYWCGHTVEHILALENLLAIEVYNATCGKIGKADSSVIWDYLLAAGRMLPAVAVDDVHRGRDIFMGWTMIRAAERSPAAVLAALRSGAFYASCGPEIKQVIFDGEAFVLECSPVREIHFICRGASGGSFYAEDGEVLRGARFQPAVGAPYIRIQIVDHQGRRAWTNPFTIS